MKRVESFEDLEIWQLGMDLLVEIYALTRTLPDSERFNLISQANRAVVSIPCNIAEGWGRGRSAGQAQFVRISRGSLYELLTLLLAIKRLGLDEKNAVPALRSRCELLGRKLNAYLKQLEASYAKEEIAQYQAEPTN
jgi:four helix bundle protein